MGLHWLKKARAFSKCSWEQKRRVKKFFDCKILWETRKNQISIYPSTMNILNIVEIYLYSRNSQMFYIINIISFSKFAQEIYFYLQDVSLYFIQSELTIFIHSFISSRIPCPNEWFQVEFFWRKCNEKLHFRI